VERRRTKEADRIDRCRFVASLSAQWLDRQTPNIPRLANGKANLIAAPRKANGQLELSGIRQVLHQYCSTSP
jgi:hypothetical protein